MTLFCPPPLAPRRQAQDGPAPPRIANHDPDRMASRVIRQKSLQHGPILDSQGHPREQVIESLNFFVPSQRQQLIEHVGTDLVLTDGSDRLIGGAADIEPSTPPAGNFVGRIADAAGGFCRRDIRCEMERSDPSCGTS